MSKNVKKIHYHENETINYHKCKMEIFKGLDACASKLAVKYNLNIEAFDRWKSNVKEKVAEKVRNLEFSRQPQLTRPISKDEDALLYLKDLQCKFVIVPIWHRIRGKYYNLRPAANFSSVPSR